MLTQNNSIGDLLAEVTATILPAVAVEASMYGAAGTPDEVIHLITDFLPGQVEHAIHQRSRPSSLCERGTRTCLCIRQRNWQHRICYKLWSGELYYAELDRSVTRPLRKRLQTRSLGQRRRITSLM